MANKDIENSEVEPLEENQEVLDGDKETSKTESAQDEYGEEHDDDHVNLPSQVLRVLAILAIGAVSAVWAAPKIAPMLPAGLKPVAEFLSPQADISAQIATMQTDFEARLAKIETDNDQQKAVAKISPLLKQLQSKDVDLAANIDALTKAIKTQDAALETLQSTLTKIIARQAMTAQNGQISDEALQQLESRLAAITAAQKQLNQSQTLAVEAQHDATGKLRMAGATSALTQILNALDAGKPFQKPLVQFTDVSGITAPAELTDIAANGTPSLSVLKKQLPEIARIALRDDTAANAGGTTLSKFTSFLKSQVGTRSLEPQSGDSLDAVLSRIEAALNAGSLDVALTETIALSKSAKQTMGGWITSLTQLSDATTAVQALQQQLMAN